MSVIGEVVAGVLADVIAATGRQLGTAAMLPHGRRHKKDVELVRWFDTYQLTDLLPPLPESWEGITARELARILERDEVHAVLHELLAARLTRSPETDVRQVETAFTLELCAATGHPDTPTLADLLFTYYDDEICGLVGRLAGSRPDLLRQVREEALGFRMIATLHAIERHVAALSARPDREVEADFLVRYRRHVAEHHGMLEPPDFDRRRRIPIADLYVPPTLIQVIPAGWLTRVIDLWQLDNEIDRTVLLGDPGSGKTTAAQVLMHRHVNAPGGRVPFLVTLREFAADNPPARSVVGYIEHKLDTFYQCPAPTGMVTRLLLSGSALLVFDGLDELTDATRRAEVTAVVERFCAEYPLAHVLVTSRAVGYEQARLDDRQFSCYRIGGFDDERSAEYVRKWFAQEQGSELGEAEIHAAAFMDETADVPDLRSNPLMLALMCILYRGEGSLPRNRPDVYHQCASLLFRKWDTRRHIPIQLRAGPLAEPTVRHLAYWLFMRGQIQPAVAERELLSETTSFLYGRGFEVRDNAAEAAQEFVAFCRNRAWVFSNVGTTADGEPLYTFTHRTFLEYFAAAHLAAIHDSPEDLARALAQHIAQQEWEVVAELAARVKGDSSDRGAQRFYNALLLSGHKRRSVEEHSNVLQFLARCLRSIEPPPQAIRDLTRAILEHLFAGDVSDEIRYLPLSWLLAGCSHCQEVVKDELSARMVSMTASADAPTRLNGLRLAVWISRGAVFQGADRVLILVRAPETLANFWDDFARDNAGKYAADLVTAAREDDGLMYAAVRHGFLGVDEVLSWSPSGLSLLFKVHRATIFDAFWVPYLIYQVFAMARGWTRHMHSGLPIGSEDNWTHDFSAVGQFLIKHDQPPWVFMHHSSWYEPAGIFDDAIKAGPAPSVDLTNPAKYLGVVTTVLIAAELFRDRTLPKGEPFPLGELNKLYPYILRRWGMESDAILPAIPVPGHFQRLFTAWASRTIDFVQYQDDSPDGPAASDTRQ